MSTLGNEGIEGILLHCTGPAAAISNNLVGRLVVKLNMPLLKLDAQKTNCAAVAHLENEI